MLHRDFEKFLNALSMLWVTDETIRGIALSLEILPKDWPDCEAKKLVLAYDNLWPKIGHVKARREISSLLMPISEIADTDVIPDNINKLRAAYDSVQFNQRAMEVGLAISEDPSNAYEIFSRLQSNQPRGGELFDVAEISESHFSRLCEEVSSGKMIRYLPSWPKLSEMIAGFNPGRLGMILAESGFGKSNLCLNLAISAQKEFRVVYFNMEMLIEDMMDRVHVITSKMTWKDLKSGNVPTYDSTQGKLQKGNLLMTDGVDKSLDQIRLITKRINHERHVDLVVVDYDQKIILKHDSKTPEWKALQEAFISLESLAKEIGCYVLVAAQSSNEDGKVSGSLRSKFPCSTVLFFHDHPKQGPIISVKKNRFESTKQFLKVDYNPQSSSVKELEIVYERPEEIKSMESTSGPKKTINPTPTLLPYAD